MTEQKSETFADKLIENLKDPMIIILIVALVVVLGLAILGYTEWYEGVGIALAVSLATLVSTYSEFKNEETFQKLQAEASRIFLNVYRGEQLRLINIDEIVALTIPRNQRSWRVMQRLGMTHDEKDNFHHPRFEKDNPFSKHILYRACRKN